MFFAKDSTGKSTVVCVHPRFFVTFRHGTHLQFRIGDVLRIFPAMCETNRHEGYDVAVVDINEMADFVLLRSHKIIVEVNLPILFLFTVHFFLARTTISEGRNGKRISFSRIWKQNRRYSTTIIFEWHPSVDSTTSLLSKGQKKYYYGLLRNGAGVSW